MCYREHNSCFKRLLLFFSYCWLLSAVTSTDPALPVTCSCTATSDVFKWNTGVFSFLFFYFFHLLLSKPVHPVDSWLWHNLHLTTSTSASCLFKQIHCLQNNGLRETGDRLTLLRMRGRVTKKKVILRTLPKWITTDIHQLHEAVLTIQSSSIT